MTGIVVVPADVALLAWIQNRLVLSIAASYGHDMTDHMERAAELLVIQGVHNSSEIARQALVKATKDAVRKLILRHLRTNSLVLVKKLFNVVGSRWWLLARALAAIARTDAGAGSGGQKQCTSALPVLP